MIDIKKIIEKYSKELSLLQVEFTGLRADYENHVKLGQQKEKNLNDLAMKMHDKQNIIDGYRKDFNITVPKLPSVKRPAKKHLKKGVRNAK